MNIQTVSKISAAFAALVTAAALTQAATLLHEFTFNDSANVTSTMSTGTLGGLAAMTNYVSVGSADRAAANLRGASGSGVSGKAGDYAFDNSISTLMGGSGTEPGYGGLAALSGGAASINGMKSFTLAGWYKSSSTPGNNARLIEIGSTAIWFQQGGGLRLTANVDGSAVSRLESVDSRLMQVGTWTFFAFTYDSISGQVYLYAGTRDSETLEFIASNIVSNPKSVTTTVTQDLAIGNSFTLNQQRPYQGRLDNFRLWGETTGSGGALSLVELQNVMTADITGASIPEPTTTAAFLGGAGLLLVMAARKVFR